MKIKNITILFAGLAIPAVASAQPLFVDPLAGNTLTLNLMQDMAQASDHLYSTNASGSGYTRIWWAPGGPLGNGGNGQFQTNATPMQNPNPDYGNPQTETTFKEIKPNFGAFIVNNSVDIGFFGREAWDANELSLKAESMDGTIVQTLDDPLFTYDKDSFAAAAFALNPVSGSTPFKLSFYHLNIPGNKEAGLGDPLKFKIFRSFITVNSVEILTNEYILAIDDRMNNEIDFDDGFFYVTGDITPVPEPSLIAGLAVLGMGGFLVIRRRLIAKRKQA